MCNKLFIQNKNVKFSEFEIRNPDFGFQIFRLWNFGKFRFFIPLVNANI